MIFDTPEARILHLRKVIHDREYELAMVRRRLKKGEARSGRPKRLQHLRTRAEQLPGIIQRFRAALERIEPPKQSERMPSLDIHGSCRWRASH